MDKINNKYSRQILFWPDGEISQAKLEQKVVTIIGIGALGTTMANHLVRSGVGEVRLIDRDFVEESNLQRQMLFDEADARNQTPKAIAAAEKLATINSKVKVIALIENVDPSNIETLIKGSDLILDGTDNMMTRFLINDVSIKHSIPWIYGGVVKSRGMTTTIIPNKTPCFRCLFPELESGHGETCDTVGVLSTAVYIVASYQATEALKILIEDKSSIREEMIQLDVWKNDFDLFPFQLSLNETCICCQKREFQFLTNELTGQLVSSLCGRNAIQIIPSSSKTIDLSYFYHNWSKLGKVIQNPYLLRLTYEEYQLSLFSNGRMLVQGTNDKTVAMRIYTTLVGE
ncbi:ThiF family adenylyltransferase [Bacillaceae bacterium IKA-2]|nr:ThiF family adenylyltransferase [Bacillaceae bacterium IKA-2]